MPDDIGALNPIEVRVLASLVEKQITTPDYYPLTLNALTNACNQTSNRDPVLSFDEQAVIRAVDTLREKKLAHVTTGGLNRVAKYGQRFAEAFVLDPAQAAILCELMLRGPQTVGELRGRASRMHEFPQLAEVEQVLGALAALSPRPLVQKLPRQTGFKESRYAHLLGGPVGEGTVAATRTDAFIEPAPASDARTARLEEEVASLRREVATLREELESFRGQFR